MSKRRKPRSPFQTINVRPNVWKALLNLKMQLMKQLDRAVIMSDVIEYLIKEAGYMIEESARGWVELRKIEKERVKG